MDMYTWIDRIIIEGIKYIILGHWFFGMEFSQKESRYLVLSYPILLLLVGYFVNWFQIYPYYHLWRILLLLFLLEGGLLEKFKLYFVIWFTIAMTDIIFVILVLLFINLDTSNHLMAFQMDCASCIFWIILAWKGKRLQKFIQSFWKKMSIFEYGLLLVTFVIMSFFLGGIQSYLYNEIRASAKEALLVFSVLAVGLFFMILTLLFYTKQSKKRLEKMNSLNLRYLKLQKKYYEASLKQYDDMRRFRHDINHHIYMLSELSEENKMKELKEYIGTMSGSFEKMRGLHTGNFISDCILSHILNDLEKRDGFSFQMDGRFPKEFFMEDIDFCILLSNLLENAKEAVEKIEYGGCLHIEVKHFKQWFYLIVSNSAMGNAIDFTNTSKGDKKLHGYGIENIIQIVEKYHGTVDWNLDNSMVRVKIKFDVSKISQ